MKTEQRRKMKSKATERSFNESWKKFVIFNCGTSEKMWVYNYNFAKKPVDCLHNSREPNLLDEIGADAEPRSSVPSRHKPAQAFVTRRGDVTEWMRSVACNRPKDMESTSTKVKL